MSSFLSRQEKFGFGLFSFLLGALLATVIVETVVSARWRQLAIQHGAAQWRIDATTGETEFVWLHCKGIGDEQ